MRVTRSIFLFAVFCLAACGSSDGSLPSGDAGIVLPETCPCPAGSFCDLATNSCRLGCLGDPDCKMGQYCDVTARACVAGCREDVECGAGSTCEDHQCVDTCSMIACNMAPPKMCSGNAVRTYSSPGTCAVGACTYPFVDKPCPGGCSGAACTAGWFPLVQTGAPAGRSSHSAVWTGTAMIVWGGQNTNANELADGASFNPSTGTWTVLPTTGAPVARVYHTAVWTGSEMIVWGGINYDVPSQQQMRNDGARFNPTTGTWTPLSTTGAPIARYAHSAVWTGTEMIVWGGGTFTGALRDGGRYNPTTNTWSPLSTTTAPSTRNMHTAVWTGTEMIVWGGYNTAVTNGYLSDGARFNPATNVWTTLSSSGAPTPRRLTAAAWTGSAMLVWGGEGPGGFADMKNDGGKLTGTSWTSLPTTNAPIAREGHTAVWTGTDLLVWGGFVNGGGYRNDGGRYVP
jgi:hypothetical protein